MNVSAHARAASIKAMDVGATIHQGNGRRARGRVDRDRDRLARDRRAGGRLARDRRAGGRLARDRPAGDRPSHMQMGPTRSRPAAPETGLPKIDAPKTDPRPRARAIPRPRASAVPRL